MQELILQEGLRFIPLPGIEGIKPVAFASRIGFFINTHNINGKTRLEAIFGYSTPVINADGQRSKFLYGNHCESVAENNLTTDRFLPRL